MAGATVNVDLTVEQDTFRLAPNSVRENERVVTVLPDQRQSAPQYAGIVGQVRNDSMVPVAGVTVTVAGLKRAARANSLGEFRIDSIPVGLVRLVARHVGFLITVRDSVPVIANAMMGVDLVLHADRLRNAIQVAPGFATPLR